MEGGYEVSNATVVLRNTGLYFSRYLAHELPDNKFMEIFMVIGSQEVLKFSGTVPPGGWTFDVPMKLTLNLNI
jgi:hypothetical protein